MASLRGRVDKETNENESRSERNCAAEFHHINARSRLARVVKLMNCLFL